MIDLLGGSAHRVMGARRRVVQATVTITCHAEPARRSTVGPTLMASLPRFALPVRRVLAALVVPLTALVTGCEQSDTSPTAVRVVRGSVDVTVTATGTLKSISEQKIGFAQAGRLAELKIAVGDQVTPGQPLARIDDTEQRLALRKAQDQVEKEQAALDRILDGNQEEGTQEELRRAREVLDSAIEYAEEVKEADNAAINQAERELAFDKAELARQEEQLKKDWRECKDAEDTILDPQSTADERCDRVEDRKDKIADTKRDVLDDQAALDAARHQRDVDCADREHAIDVARRDLTDAENEAELAASDRPYNIDEQQALLDQAKVELERAQGALDATVLRSSVSGTVASINGSVGQILNAFSGSTSPAPGSSEAGTGVAVGRNADTADRPGGAEFIVLDNVNTFQVTAPFSEADAARIKPNQAAEVTFDAVPGLARKGTVASIEPAEARAGAVSNRVTVVLTELDPRLKDDLVARAHVIVGRVDNVLVVPTAAVRGDRTRTVSVLQPDGTQRDVPVELGTVGAVTSQVVSGLREGDQVMVPRAR